MQRILLIMLTLLFSLSSHARYGIGYAFFDRLVAKKVYASPDRNKIQESDIRVKMQNAGDLLKDFEFRLSRRGLKNFSSAVPFDNRVSHPNQTTDITRVLKVSARFSYPWNNYVELTPKTPLILPKWAKSVDLWAFGIRENLAVYVYISTKPNNIRRIKMGQLNHYHWKKLYANIFDQTFKNERQTRLVRIRIVGHRQNAISEFTTYLADLKTYNYLKSEKNLYLNPVDTLVDIENTEVQWQLQIGQQRVNRNFYARIFDNERNRSVLLLNIPGELHKNLDSMIFFNKPHILRKGYSVSVWIRGKGNREDVSLIFRDRKSRLFEVEFCRVEHTGWKRFTVYVPDVFFLNMPGYERLPYITLWGMKISPRENKDIDFAIDNIDSFKDFRFDREFALNR